ncbi:NADPH-dependent FMN reductase [Lentibacillus amyloliquefaciens]|uniref:NADPH-dependent FMN reductase n=1 Tax=Lentibacillus amyloliquefaciens TaxID=1472767 RepID=A0A0U4GAR9_9BACI|nr:NADPH-dependent FMN reductase [Lentibacillus amyloliquefaciens]ALX49818.1 NADPH-dependent FMN reductase [Lentibacillus amyloliquefaciens]
MTIKVKAIIGSTSSNSFNYKVVDFMKKRYANKLDIIPVFINDVENFSQDIEEYPPVNAQKFKDEVKDSDAVLFAVPEYNFSIPGRLKNAIDWLSRGGDLTLNDKPGFIIGASPGVLGSVRAQQHLREILSNPALSPVLLPKSEVYIGAVHEKLNESGEITDQGTIEFLDTVVDNFVDFYNKINSVETVKA